MLITNFKLGWHQNALIRLYRNRTMRLHLRNARAQYPLAGFDDAPLTRKYRSFKTFESLSAVDAWIAAGKVLTGIIDLDSTHFLVAVKSAAGEGECRHHHVVFDDANGSSFADCYFTPVSIDHSRFVDNPKYEEFALLLPWSLIDTRDVGNSKGYYCLTSEWRERLESGDVCMPRLDGVTY